MSDPVDLIALMPFAEATGVVLDSADADRVVGHLDWAQSRCTAGGVLHGGALMTLADSIGAVCAFLGLPPGATTATTTSSTQLMRGVSGGTVTATARPLHRGRTQVVVQTELCDTDGRLVAVTTQTQAVLTAS
ncbi:PaaI family thioesterase [Nocardioides jensenii]|uniref:PaaI family thioesterase n=1 Tax=Nocardioides jensenii TaxID=1843 RepID=UPI00082F61E1|nr:PaaI family thioesterase [Nocardioides jensenii]